MRLSAAIHTSLSVRNAPRNIAKAPIEEIDSLLGWCLPSIFSGPWASAAGLAFPEEVPHYPSAHQRQRTLGENSIVQARRPRDLFDQ